MLAEYISQRVCLSKLSRAVSSSCSLPIILRKELDDGWTIRKKGKGAIRREAETASERSTDVKIENELLIQTFRQGTYAPGQIQPILLLFILKKIFIKI